MDSKNIAGISFDEIEKYLQKAYSDECIYYKQLKSNYIPLFTKLSYAIGYLLENDKTNIAIFHYCKNKREIPEKIPKVAKKAKVVTLIINSLYDHRKIPKLDEILQLQRIESNRLLRYNVPDSMILLFLILSGWRNILGSFPSYDPEIKKLKGIMQKKLPEFAIS